jgi:hypothetical protein
MSMSILVHIKVRDITFKIFGVEGNQQAGKSDSIVHTHHFAMSLNVHLKCENKDGEFYRTCLHIYKNYKCRL